MKKIYAVPQIMAGESSFSTDLIASGVVEVIKSAVVPVTKTVIAVAIPGPF